MEEASMPHVVVCPDSAAGHNIPFLQFVRRLGAEGVVITIASSDRHILELKSLVGSSPDLIPQGLPLRLLGLRDNKPHLLNSEWRKLLREPGSKENLRVIHLLQELVTDVASSDSQQLRGVQPAGPPVCIIYDMFNVWAQTAAKELRIESHLLWVSPACWASCAMEAPRLFQDGRLPITRDTRDMIFADIPGLPPTRAMDLPAPLLEPSASLGEIQKSFAHISQADVILINTCYALEKPVLDARSGNEGVGSSDLQAKHFLDIGPLLLETSVLSDGGAAGGTTQQILEETDPCMLWLNTQAPNSVLFISFGSWATLSARQLVEMALGLEASGACFLWILKPPNAGPSTAASRTPVPVKEYLPPGFEERIKGRGLCYSGWAPQMRILKHPAVGGFLSHCGWNSSLETLSAGVPVLAWPMNAEQHLIRRSFVDRLKVAIELKANAYTKDELESDVPRPVVFMSKEEIARKARSLMQEAEGQVVRENIQKLWTECLEAVAAGGSSRRNLETYVRHLHSIAQSRSASHFGKKNSAAMI
ncbi:hypothetical protein M758_6G057900 [Ceratodon purpureus]|nr:hypothetical protein M758_6G057900 [Ceratodon purpureus]